MSFTNYFYIWNGRVYSNLRRLQKAMNYKRGKIDRYLQNAIKENEDKDIFETKFLDKKVKIVRDGIDFDVLSVS